MREIMQLSWIRLLLLLTVAATANANASPLADAAEQQNWSAVRSLAEKTTDIDAAQADGSSALLWAAHHDNLEMVGLLLDRGASVNIKNRYGIFPLSEAALNRNAGMVERMIAAGAEVNAALPGGDTALMTASRSGSAAAVKLLLARGAQVDARETWHGETALMWAAGENHADVVRLLVEAGADINAKSATLDWKDIKHGGVQSQLPIGGLTALMNAARQNAFDAAVALLDLGADANAKDPQGVSTLRIAAANGHLDLANALIEHGADVNEGGLVEAVKVGTTSVMRAATDRPNSMTVQDLVKVMIARGAKADSLAAVAMPKKDAFGGNNAAGGPPTETALYFAAGAGDVELMQLLLDHGADVSHATKTGATPLMAALEFTPRRPQAQGATLPPKRSIESRKAVALMVLAHGADINAADATGMTALHWMADQGTNELVQFLVEHGAKLGLKDKSNRTALDVANNVPAIRAPGAPAINDPGPILNVSTVTALRTLMADAGVREVPYKAPVVAQVAAAETPAAPPAAQPAPGAAPQQKPVTAIIGRE